jgi:hypothetical protein
MVTRMGILVPLVPGELIATAPLYVPGFAASGEGFTVTCRVSGKLPAIGLTLSQDSPLLVIGLAVKLVTLELELERLTVCDAAVVLLAGKTKLSEFGLAEMGPGAPLEFAFKVTGTERDVAGEVDVEVMLIKPTSTPEVGAPAPIETVTTKGVAPVEGVTVSQLLSERAVMETFAVPLLEEIRMAWGIVATLV